MEPREVVWIFCSFMVLLHGEVKVRKGNLSLFPNGPVFDVIFVNGSGVKNQTYGHGTMIDSLKTIMMKLHSFDTATYQHLICTLFAQP